MGMSLFVVWFPSKIIWRNKNATTHGQKLEAVLIEPMSTLPTALVQALSALVSQKLTDFLWVARFQPIFCIKLMIFAYNLLF